MKKWLIISVFLLGLLILFASMALVYLGTKQTGKATQTFNPLPKIDIPGLPKTQATLLLLPAASVINKGSTFSADLRMKANNSVLVAMAVKLTMKYDGQLPLKPQSAKLETNPELIKAGWNYTINRVIVDNQNKTLSIELLMVNLEPNGYRINNEISLGGLEFTAQPSTSSATFNFDSALTKIKDKNGKTLKLNLEGAHYTIH